MRSVSPCGPDLGGLMKKAVWLAAVFALTACSTGGAPEAADVTPSVPQTTGTPTATRTTQRTTHPPTTAQLKISEQAVCLDVFDDLQDAADIVLQWTKDSSGGGVTADQIEPTIRALQHAAAVGPDDMAPYFEAEIAPLQTMVDLLQHGGSVTLDMQDFKSAGLELATRCVKYAN